VRLANGILRGMSIVLNVESTWVSPYVFACFVTLREKGLAFDARVLESAKNETRASDYLRQTVTGRVPSLVHDGFGLAESSAIIEYLEETFPQPSVFPSGTRDRARCRQLMSWLRSDETAKIREERSATTMFYERTRTPLSTDAVSAVTKLCEVTKRVLRPGNATIFDAWTIVDAELAFLLHRLILNGDPLPDDVRAWAETQWQRPSVQAFVQRER
jgi:glutathione S-transferase